MLLAALGSVRIGKNCDFGLENVAVGLRPRAAFSRVVYTVVDKYHFFLMSLNRRNNALSVGSQRLRPDTKVHYFGNSKPFIKK